METIISVIRKIDPFYLVLTAMIQQLFAIFWFGWIVDSIEHYYYAVDKGVRRSEHAIKHYSALVISLVTFLCCLARSAVIFALAFNYKASTLADYQAIGLLVGLASLISIHRDLSRQRPIQLLMTQGIYEVGVAMLAAASAYYLWDYGC